MAVDFETTEDFMQIAKELIQDTGTFDPQEVMAICISKNTAWYCEHMIPSGITGKAWESACDDISQAYSLGLLEIAKQSQNGKSLVGKHLQSLKYQQEQEELMSSRDAEYETVADSPLGRVVTDENGETFVLVPKDLAQLIFEQAQTLELDAEFREEELLFADDFVEITPIGSSHAKVFHGVRGEGEDIVDYIIQEESVDGEKCYRILLVIEQEEPLEVYESAIVLRKKPKGIVERAMVNHMLIEQAEIEQAILELENAVRLGLVSEEELMMSLKQRFGAETTFDYHYSAGNKYAGSDVLDMLRSSSDETKAQAIDWLIDEGFLHSEELYNAAYVLALGDALGISVDEDEWEAEDGMIIDLVYDEEDARLWALYENGRPVGEIALYYNTDANDRRLGRFRWTFLIVGGVNDGLEKSFSPDRFRTISQAVKAFTANYENNDYDSWEAEDRDEDERMTRAEAEALADKMTKLLEPYCDFVEVCGSYRRGREDPGDLDIVIILKEGESLPDIVDKLSGEYTAVNWLGEKKTQIIVDGVKVDIRVSTPEGLGAALLYFTGPSGYNIGLRRSAKKRGMKLNEYGMWDRDTKEYLGGATEEEVYKLLDKDWKAPELRRAEETQGMPDYEIGEGINWMPYEDRTSVLKRRRAETFNASNYRWEKDVEINRKSKKSSLLLYNDVEGKLHKNKDGDWILTMEHNSVRTQVPSFRGGLDIFKDFVERGISDYDDRHIPSSSRYVGPDWQRYSRAGGWGAETFEAERERRRDKKGRLVPKLGCTKWGNDYWPYGVTKQEWKYRHPACVRVYAEAYGVNLKELTKPQKDYLTQLYMEDVDSQTAFWALVEEFDLKHLSAETFNAEREVYVLRFSDPMKYGKTVELPFLTKNEAQRYVDMHITPSSRKNKKAGYDEIVYSITQETQDLGAEEVYYSDAEYFYDWLKDENFIFHNLTARTHRGPNYGTFRENPETRVLKRFQFRYDYEPDAHFDEDLANPNFALEYRMREGLDNAAERLGGYLLDLVEQAGIDLGMADWEEETLAQIDLGDDVDEDQISLLFPDDSEIELKSRNVVKGFLFEADRTQAPVSTGVDDLEQINDYPPFVYGGGFNVITIWDGNIAIESINGQDISQL